MTVTLILGAAVWADGPSPTLKRRTLHAARLFHDGVASHLVPCGGVGRVGPAEAEVMRDLLISEGVPPDAITPEALSTSTWENIGFACPILDRLRTKDVLIVSDRYHLPRARLAARRFGLRATGAPTPWQGANPKEQLRQSVREVPAIAWYLVRRTDLPVPT
ncbi:YdcF family protein [Pelagovum pacificum]|uniref:YdcF family protein n=1 Tax=Pelagovum pacificum TaxID=2588711 RepID=A0A5C5GBF5_9RHOB|nr:YdcF family protein [Pelagovum pacificum]QQA42217.1 YdcF family protein [Pelagovum pacificum]TNY31304.1 YdcF family protein [Pelagovum pacificum]